MRPTCYDSAKLTARSAASIAAGNGDLRDLGYYKDDIDPSLFWMDDKDFRFMVDVYRKTSTVWENVEPKYQSHDDCLESWSYTKTF